MRSRLAPHRAIIAAAFFAAPYFSLVANLPAAPRIGALLYQVRSASDARMNQGILFVGSSIFQFWRHLDEQMAPLPVMNRAIAGTVTQDQLDRVGQLVFPYKPRIIVYYCGSNDVGAGDVAAPIIARTKRFMDVVHEKLPETFIYYTAIMKAPDKRDRWDVVEEVNREMERYSHTARNVGFIDLNPVLFDHGKLRENLFLPDELHFRPESTAYPEFAQVVKPILTKAWESGVGIAKGN
jgi:lysophospholipase L1-like esterase